MRIKDYILENKIFLFAWLVCFAFAISSVGSLIGLFLGWNAPNSNIGTHIGAIGGALLNLLFFGASVVYARAQNQTIHSDFDYVAQELQKEVNE